MLLVDSIYRNIKVIFWLSSVYGYKNISYTYDLSSLCSLCFNFIRVLKKKKKV